MPGKHELDMKASSIHPPTESTILNSIAWRACASEKMDMLPGEEKKTAIPPRSTGPLSAKAKVLRLVQCTARINPH